MLQRPGHHYGPFGKWWGPSLPSVAVIKHWRKTTWEENIYLTLKTIIKGSLHGNWRQEPGGGHWNRSQSTAHKLSSRILLLLKKKIKIKPKPTCLGIALSTVGCTLPHWLAIKKDPQADLIDADNRGQHKQKLKGEAQWEVCHDFRGRFLWGLQGLSPFSFSV